MSKSGEQHCGSALINKLARFFKVGTWVGMVFYEWHSLPLSYYNHTAGFEPCQSRLIHILERLTSSKERDLQPEYLYYGIPSPWLQVRFGVGVRATGYGQPDPKFSAQYVEICSPNYWDSWAGRCLS